MYRTNRQFPRAAFALVSTPLRIPASSAPAFSRTQFPLPAPGLAARLWAMAPGPEDTAPGRFDVLEGW